jgi:predicted O-methyltransferase YrrM
VVLPAELKTSIKRIGRAIDRRLFGGGEGAARAGGPNPAAPKKTWVEPGHFYSPIPSFDELRPRLDRIFGSSPPALRDVDVNSTGQLEVLEALVPLHDRSLYLDPNAFASDRLRYRPDNSMFGRGSAIGLELMLRHLNPKRVVEVGSGYSSAVMLDTADDLGRPSFELTFIEPYPDRLYGLLKPGDRQRVDIRVSKLEDVPESVFEALQPGDVLFVDSSHVMKTGSDVHRLLFDLLPALANGVVIHFHDVLYPFEYPKRWVEEGRAWNEAYALRAFLAYNRSFEIYFWASYLYQHEAEAFRRLPGAFADGSSLWIRKGSWA